MIILAIILSACTPVVINNSNGSDGKESEKIQIIKKEPVEEKDSVETNSNTEINELDQNITQQPKYAPSTPNTSNGSTYTYDQTLAQAKSIANQITSTLQTTQMNAYLRGGPGIGYSALVEVPAGVTLYVQSTSVEASTYRIWCYVSYGSRFGWISYKTLNPGYSLQTEFQSGS